MDKNSTIGNKKIASLFDAATFVEIGAYIKRSGADSAYDGVICGYGSISGKLAFAFVQDSDRTKGAFDEIGAKKLCMLYDMAIKNGAPVIGVFDSAGAVVYDGSSACSAYGNLMANIARASGLVPQIAILDGICTGLSLCAAAMFDLVIKVDEVAKTYISSTSQTNKKAIKPAICAKNEAEAFATARELIEILPQNNNDSACIMSGDDANRRVNIDSLTGYELCSALCDNGKLIELYPNEGKELVCALGFFGGVLCAIIASNHNENCGKLTCRGAKKAADVIAFADRFNISIVTLVDCEGFSDNMCATSAATLVSAFANATAPKVSAVCGKAYGAGFTLLGSKSIGADIAFAVNDATIAVMSPDTAVAFISNDEITHTKSRAEVEGEWCEKYASAFSAAEKGDIDDVIAKEELRARICAALYMLQSKTDTQPQRKHFKVSL